MRPSSRTCRRAAVSAAAALVGLLAGCGSGVNTAAQTSTHPHAHASDLGPVAGSRSLAVKSARLLLARLVLPGGSRQLPERLVPAVLDQPGLGAGGAGNLLDLHRFYRLPMTMTDALAFLKAHVPRGTVGGSASGEAASNGVVTSDAVTATGRRVPPGIDLIVLVATVAPGPDGSSVLRVDAQVFWYPPRTAIEYLIATRFRSVRISLWSGSASSTTTGITGGQRLIGPLAGVLDSMHATPPLLMPCPFMAQNYKLAFAPAVPGQLPVVVESASCNTDTVTVGGRPQPLLDDTGALDALVTRLVREYAPAVR